MFDHKWVTLPKLKQINTPEGRRYEIEGTEFRYPSITTVLSDTADKTWLYEWRKRVGEEKANAISQQSTRRGTSMHKLCELYLKNEPAAEMPTDDEELVGIGKGDWSAGQLMFCHIRPALDKLNNVRLLESRLFSHRLKVAGTVDCVAEYNGDLAIVDFKTAKRTKRKEDIEDYFMQGAFYFNAYYENTGELPKKIAILISVIDGSLQEYVLSGKEIIYWTERLAERIDAFYYNKGI